MLDEQGLGRSIVVSSEVISGPLSQRVCSGTQWIGMVSSKVSMTFKLLKRHPIRIARASRVDSSIRVKILLATVTMGRIVNKVIGPDMISQCFNTYVVVFEKNTFYLATGHLTFSYS